MLCYSGFSFSVVSCWLTFKINQILKQKYIKKNVKKFLAQPQTNVLGILCKSHEDSSHSTLVSTNSTSKMSGFVLSLIVYEEKKVITQY